MQTINEYGRMEIVEFLQNNHKYFINRHISHNDEIIRAWAADAEFQLREGNNPSIEIPGYQCTKGNTVVFTVSEKGVD